VHFRDRRVFLREIRPRTRYNNRLQENKRNSLCRLGHNYANYVARPRPCIPIQQQRRRLQFLQIFGYFGSQLCDVGIRLCRRTRIDGQNHLQRARIRGFRRNVLLYLPKLHQGTFQQR